MVAAANIVYRGLNFVKQAGAVEKLGGGLRKKYNLITDTSTGKSFGEYNFNNFKKAVDFKINNLAKQYKENKATSTFTSGFQNLPEQTKKQILQQAGEKRKLLSNEQYVKIANKKENLKKSHLQLGEKLNKNYVTLSGQDFKTKAQTRAYYERNRDKVKEFTAQTGKKKFTPAENLALIRKSGKTERADQLEELLKTDRRKAIDYISKDASVIRAKQKDPKKFETQMRGYGRKFRQSEKGKESAAKKISGHKEKPVGVTPDQKIFSYAIEAHQKNPNGRIQAVGKVPSKAEIKNFILTKGASKEAQQELMRKFKFKDTHAIDPRTGRPPEFTVDSLEDYVTNSVGLNPTAKNTFRKGNYMNSINNVHLKDEIMDRKLPGYYEGTKNQTLNGLISKIKGDNTTFNLHHFNGGIGDDFFSVQLTTSRQNQAEKILFNKFKGYRDAVNRNVGGGSIVQKTEDGTVLRTVSDADDWYARSIENLNGIQSTNTYSNKLVGVQPNIENIMEGAFFGLNRSALRDRLIKEMLGDPTEVQSLFLKDGGRVGMDSGGLSLNPEDIQKEIDRALEEDGEILSEKEAIDNIVQLRLGFDEGGRVGLSNGGSLPNYVIGNVDKKPVNKVGTIESMLAGIGAGIIDIPKGAFTLGAALMDLGLGTNNAAKVEQWFDNLTDLDEKADQTVAGEMVRFLTNLGIPGAAAWKMGTSVTKNALLAKRNGNYFRITDPKLEERMKTALNAKGRIAATLGGAAAAGVSDAIFVGDPETVGTMGDLFGGGPTQLKPNDSNSASREVMNRIKFGLDGALFLGVIGGTGSSIKSAIARRNDLEATNSTLDKFLSKLRPRGAKPQEFFEMERANIGLRAADVNYASQVARKLDKHIDAIFPFVKNPFSKMGNKGRAEFMDELNETLLSGKIEMDVTGKSAFGEMDPERIKKIVKMMRDRGAKQEDIDGVLDSFEQMRLGWAHMFSRLGYSMKEADPKVLEEFKGIIGKKFKSYLGSTYEIFQNRSLIPLLNYAPTEEAVNKAVKMVQDSARMAGKNINDEEARHFVDKMIESARLPRGLATSKEKTTGIYLEVPDFFANKTVLSDLEFNPKIALDSLTPDARKVIDEVLGKVADPMQTMLAGSGRLSLITRRNQFYEELLKKSADDIAAKKKGFFYDTELDAFNALGGNIKKIEIDPSRTIEAGITNPLNGKYAERGVAEAIEESAMLARDKGTVRQMYDSLILYPKATSQIAKTILSPVTHVRNFVSAGAFAGANGLIPGLVSPEKMAAAMKDAYKALQIPGARMANEEYRELLRLGVVNSNVRLGDLQRLLQDVNFGETLTAQKGLRGLIRPLSKAKKWTEEMYTAEDDFWKITSYALERQRLSRAYGKYGIKVNDELLNEEAASIVRNNIPNYDMVNDFIKGLRQLPFGNFVSFPAEIMRTTTNILGRALKEINYQHTLDDGRVVNPLRGIGYKRLFGLGTTVVAIPYGTVEAAKAIYDVSEDEMDAMRRFVPEWSKNSTLVPIRDTETGDLKYVDFSHANAYDTMIRPINTMINSVNKGIDEGEIMKNIALGMYDATKETVSPFISESIWFEGASDIFLRNGRTREGRRLWTEETPWGEKVSITAGHLVKTQMPGSVATFERLGLAARDEVDEYGRTFELGDELAGIAGFRAIPLDPLRSMKFKIADFRTGLNNARREFTAELLKGGVVDPEDIVDRFAVANEALFKVQKRMFKDYYAARTLGVNPKSLDLQFDDRVSNVQLNAIKSGRFKPFIPSENIVKAFRDNARLIGRQDTYRLAENEIRRMIREYNKLRLFGDFQFPSFENPFSVQLPPQATVSPAAVAPPMAPTINTTGTNFTTGNQQAKIQAGQQVFGPTDKIFGTG